MPLSRLPALAVMVLLILGAGLVHGVWSSRWEMSARLQAALEPVPRVPLEFAGWQGKELEIDERLYQQAGGRAYWMRRYENTRTGTVVSVILMCGRGGPMCVHTPDVCYGGVGFTQIGPIQRLVVKYGAAETGEIWSARFRRGELDPTGQLRLYWAWNARGRWEAPEQPRFTFRGEPALYKLYVIREVSAITDSPGTDPVVAFLQDFLPELQKTLQPGLTP